MNSPQQCSQTDLFAIRPVGSSRLVLVVKGIPVPQEKGSKPMPHPNCHIPSKKNNKMWLLKTPQGKPLRRPLLITKPEYQEWTEKAVRSLESQLLSMCQTGSDGTQQVHSKLFAILSLLPADDSVNDLVEGSWKVDHSAKPGEEGATIVIERLD